MTARVTRRAGVRVAALALAVLVGSLLVGPGSASAAPTPVTCTLLGGPVNEPVDVQPNEQVQLVVVVPILGTRVNVGPAQSVGDQPGERLIQGTVTGVVGLTGQICQAAVMVVSTATSVVPLPPITLPSVPVLPPETVDVPLPGAEVGVDLGQGGSGAPPSGPGAPGQPPSAGNPPDGDEVNWRFDRARFPLYDFSSVPYGIGYRFGLYSAPAFRYGRSLPGYDPQFGILPEEDLTRVGTVDALALGGGRVALPVLLAVLLLAAVTGALVRTWTLRRA